MVVKKQPKWSDTERFIRKHSLENTGFSNFDIKTAEYVRSLILLGYPVFENRHPGIDKKRLMYCFFRETSIVSNVDSP